MCWRMRFEESCSDRRTQLPYVLIEGSCSESFLQILIALAWKLAKKFWNYHIFLTLRKFSKCLEIWLFKVISDFWFLDEPISCPDEIWLLKLDFDPKVKVWLFSVLLTILPLWMTFLENCNPRLETWQKQSWGSRMIPWEMRGKILGCNSCPCSKFLSLMS